MKVVLNVVWSIILLPLILLILLGTAVSRMCIRIGFGYAGLKFFTGILYLIAPLRIREVQPYKYPIPERFQANGHIRFTGVRTANAKGIPLKEEDQIPMLYIARLNFNHRLMAAEPEAIRQLNLEMTKRRIKAKEAFVYDENESQRFNNKIVL